ncbi:MAG: NHLP family bacteriocin export ABC transporter peptidase/permease/ATPase subunit [Oscillospiraceae bacterium]|nr:NHLP family bacteriocin export ABC transporter peptidase/permease/ATPase subunit [Oscillospiraceae bacterium]
MDNYKKTPTVFQMEATECGAASLSMIFSYFGKFLPLEQMRIETGVSRDGCKAGNIMRAAKRYGLECKGFRKEPEALRELEMPCIIHWNFNHFVVLEGFKTKGFGKKKKEYAILNDPAVGRRQLTLEEFDEGFTGVVLTFKLTEAFEKEKKVNTAWDMLKARLTGQYGVLFKLFYVGLLMVFPGLILPVLSQMFIDDILTAGYTDWLTKLLVFMGCLVVLKFGLQYYRDLVLQKLKSKLTLTSGVTFLTHMLHLPMGFFDQRFAGDLVNRMHNNTEVSDFLAGDLAETVLNILVAAFYLVILLFYSPLMTFIGLINVAVCVGMVYFSRQFISEASIKQQMSGGKLYGAVCAGLSITDTLKASGSENEYVSRVLGYQVKHTNLEQQQSSFQRILNAIPQTVGNITDVLHLLVGGILVINGQLSLGMLTAFTSLFDSFIEPVNKLVTFAQKIQTMKASITRVEDVQKYPEDARYDTEGEKIHQQKKLNGEIELKDISFGYSTLQAALVEHFDFHLYSGESIAFVGPSGCGKSTVSKIVSGLYHPWGGQILLDGKPMEKIAKSCLNASIATVSQNITLFSGSIRDNLTMWNTAILEEDMIQAAKDACIHDFIISCPGGYDYNLTENAMNLSGGQRQRLEIARALATNPSILVMDEATSALDPVVEKQVLNNIKRRGITCIIVAHRLSAFRDCNQIVVMKNGKIMQRGTHKTLMNQEGIYRTFIQNV